MMYAVVLTISGHMFDGNLASIRIARDLVMITLPERSEPPFCAAVLDEVRSVLIPLLATYASNAPPRAVSPSRRKNRTLPRKCFSMNVIAFSSSVKQSLLRACVDTMQ